MSFLCNFLSSRRFDFHSVASLRAKQILFVLVHEKKNMCQKLTGGNKSRCCFYVRKQKNITKVFFPDPHPQTLVWICSLWIKR